MTHTMYRTFSKFLNASAIVVATTTVLNVFSGQNTVLAATINLSTGLNSSGQLITSSNVSDANWTVVAPDLNINGAAKTVFRGDNDFGGAWQDNGPNSNWIAADPNRYGNGIGTYSTTFNLTGYDLSTTSLQGFFSLDDIGTISLNGREILAVEFSTYGLAGPITLAAGNTIFRQGLNTLSLTITDADNNSEGVRFEGSVTDNLTGTSVPEPFTVIGTLIGGTAAVRMRKKLKLAIK